MCVPEELSGMSDAEQMLIARLAPTVHVHVLKHGGTAWKGHCIAFPQAAQEPATVPPRLPAEVDIIRVRRQGRVDTKKNTSGSEGTAFKKLLVRWRTIILLIVTLLLMLPAYTIYTPGFFWAKSGQIAGAYQLSAVNTNQASETKKNGGRKWRIFQYSSRRSGHRWSGATGQRYW